MQIKKSEVKSIVKLDKFTQETCKAFDYEFNGESVFIKWNKPDVPIDFGIGLIVGPSGSGKSLLLKDFGLEDELFWDSDKAIVSHFDTPKDAINCLTAVGLNSIPSWMKPYHVLSTGEKFRADLSRKLKSNTVIDEFTSVVNRSAAKSTSWAFRKYVDKFDLKNIVIASCHRDIIEWLCPDWIFDTKDGSLIVGRYLRRPEIKIDIYRCSYKKWTAFKIHHYLSPDIHHASRCFIGIWDNEEVAFNASMAMPNKIPPLFKGDERKKFRESRTVVLPDYQGIGIGTRFSNAIGEIFLDDNYRFFSRTAHIRMGEYREKSSLWRPTQTNLKSRAKSQKRSKKEVWSHWALDQIRICYSHEYLGERYKQYGKGL